MPFSWHHERMTADAARIYSIGETSSGVSKLSASLSSACSKACDRERWEGKHTTPPPYTHLVGEGGVQWVGGRRGRHLCRAHDSKTRSASGQRTWRGVCAARWRRGGFRGGGGGGGGVVFSALSMPLDDVPFPPV